MQFAKLLSEKTSTELFLDSAVGQLTAVNAVNPHAGALTLMWASKFNLHLRPNLPPPGAASSTPQAQLEWICARALREVVSRGTLAPAGATFSGFLEVCSAVDISQPRPQAGAAAAVAGAGSRRVLKLGLTDGVSAAVGLETAPLADLREPYLGAKLLVRDVEVRRGVLLLAGAACVRVVCGGAAPAPPARPAAEPAAGDSDGDVVEVVSEGAREEEEEEEEGGGGGSGGGGGGGRPPPPPPPPSQLLPFLASLSRAPALGAWALLRDARVVALRGFSAAGGAFSLQALLSAGAGLQRVRALREETRELLQAADAVEGALLGGGGGGGGAPVAAWVAVTDSAVAALLGLSAAQFAADTALPKKDPRRAELKARLGEMEKALLLREGGLRVAVVARPPPAGGGGGGAILGLEACLQVAPA